MTLKPESKKAAIAKLNQLLQDTEDLEVAAIILQAIDRICDFHHIEIPEEAVSANIGLDEFFGGDVLSMR